KPDENEIQELIVNTLNEKSMLADSKRERKTEIDVLFVNHEKGKAKIKLFEKELAEKNATTENWRKLNELFGSADGAKFKVLAQGYTLDVLLGYANNHLKDISQRYLLERVSSDSLSLQVVDLDMLSEIRSVHSLSGGESFLISLALALGLSSLSSNRMRIESLFIDEGFGSLDADTLRVAMDALERLQTQGRKIGVISHVAEMTERITTQIKVIKSSNGRSKIEII
ncbi:MAG: SbcC/MukB-like Walker B domain-containing protein, partial [Akkermansia sp.]